MGFDRPRRRISTAQRQEAELARRLDEAVAAEDRADGAQSPAVAARSVQRLLHDAVDAPSGPAAKAGTALGRRGTDGPSARAAAGPAAAASKVVRLDGVEVVQEIQDLGQSVPLVAGKATVVRAYLSRPGSRITIRGELKVSRTQHGPWRTVPSIGTAALDPSRAGNTLAQLMSRRSEVAYSLNFRLPDDLIAAAGTLWFKVDRLWHANGHPVPSVAGVQKHSVNIGQGVSLRLRLVLMSYSLNGMINTPTATDVSHIQSWLGRAYPVDAVIMSTANAVATPTAPFNAADINAQLIAMRAVDVATGTDQRTHYYGMVADGGFFMRGLASGIPATPDPGVVASGPTGPNWSWDTDGSYGDWYGGHEIGHTMGRSHAEFCGASGGTPYPFPNGQLSDADDAFVGLDVGDPALGLPMRALPGTGWHDVMSYCDYEWLSSFTYGGIYTRLVAEDALQAGPLPPGVDRLGIGATNVGRPAARANRAAGVAGGGSSMRLIASLNLDRRTGAIAAVLPSNVFGPGQDADGAGPDPAGAVTVRILAADGSLLDERSVPFVRSVCEEPGQDVTGTVDAELPDPAGAATVELLVDGHAVVSHPVGGAPAVPSGPGQAPAGAAVRGAAPGGEAPVGAAEGTVRITWDAAGAPESQRYVVQVSQDGGTSWSTVAVGLADPYLDLPVEFVTADQIEVRVLATTGSGPVEVESGIVRIR
jgi:hypothetical protein